MEKTRANLKWIRRLLADKRNTVVFHNAKFDLKLFGFEGISLEDIKADVHCTLILGKLYNENLMDHGLKTLAKRWLNRDTGDKDAVNEWLKKNAKSFNKEYQRKPNFSDVPLDIIKGRALWDVETTLYLYQIFHPYVSKKIGRVYKTERKLLRVVIEMENRGVRVDLTRTKQLRSRAIRDSEKIYEFMDKLVGEITVTRKKKGEPIEVDVEHFNPGSPLDMPAAFIKLGIELKYKTWNKKKKCWGGWTFNEYAMIRYVSKPLARVIREAGEDNWSAAKFFTQVRRVIKKHKLNKREALPPLVLKYRQLTKLVSTYYDKFLADAVDRKTINGREYGILHCSFNQIEAMTGRFSSSNPNLQNQPRLTGPRECFVPRGGYHNWHIDYDQVEMKLFAHFTKDKTMVKAIAGDIHRYVASQIYGIPMDKVTSEQRKRAKAINFGVIYGAGGAKVAATLTEKGLPTTKEEGIELVAKYHRRFPSIRKIMNKLKIELHRNKFVANPFGRRYHIPSDKAYKALNNIIQGTSAEIIKEAMVKVDKWLKDNDYRTRMIIQVHDELVFEVPRNEEHIIPTLIEMMQDLTTYFTPITLSAEVAKQRWSKKISYEEYMGSVSLNDN